MANRTAALVWRCKTENGWRMFPALMGKNGRPRKGYVEVGDPSVERHYPNGYFQVRYYEGKRTVLKNVGTNANRAMVELTTRERVLEAREHAAKTNGAVQVIEDPQRRTLAKTYAGWLQQAEDRGKKEANNVYRLAGDEFFKIIRKTYVDELVAEDMLLYQRHLRKRGLGDRSIFNRWGYVKSFFLHCGFDPKKMPSEDGDKKKLIAPSYEKKDVEIYTQEEMKNFFSMIADGMKGIGIYKSSKVEDYQHLDIASRIALNCGLRDQEVQHLEWSNIKLEWSNGKLGQRKLSVKGNPRYDFKVKDYEQRELPIPQEFAERLREYGGEQPKGLVCPTENGRPDSKLLRKLKRAVHRGGLNCNDCEGCEGKKAGKETGCSNWFLHKFRATRITMWLRPKDMGGSGLDLSTVMRLSGHATIEPLMRYLKPADNKSVLESIDGTVFGD